MYDMQAPFEPNPIGSLVPPRFCFLKEICIVRQMMVTYTGFQQGIPTCGVLLRKEIGVILALVTYPLKEKKGVRR